MFKQSEVFKFIKFNISVLLTSILDITLYLFLLYYVFSSLNEIPLPENAALSFFGIRFKGYLYSYVISTSAGYIAAYLINRKITFHSDINPAYSSFLYFLLSVFNIIVSTYIGSVYGSYAALHGISSPLSEAVSKFIIINIPTIWTYPLERYVIQINRKKSLIAVDLDGTLLNSLSQISDENLRSIRRLKKKGISTAVLTGRTLYEIPENIRDCSDIEYIVYSNGAGVIDKKKNTRNCFPIKTDTAAKIYETLLNYTCFIEVYSDGYPVVSKDVFNRKSFEYYNIDEDFIPVMEQTRKNADNLKKEVLNEGKDTEMFDVFFKIPEEREKCVTQLLSEFDDIEITTSMSNNIEVVRKGINKGSGLIALSETSKIDLKSIIVIGDSKNDLTAFKTAKTKYAVSNACEEIKNIADKIICSNDENIMEYMEKELL